MGEQHCLSHMSCTPLRPTMLNQVRRHYSAPCLQPANELLSGKGQVAVGDQGGEAEGQSGVSGAVVAGVTRQRSAGLFQARSSRSSSPMALFSPQTLAHGSAAAPSSPSPTTEQHCLSHMSRTPGELAMLSRVRRYYSAPGFPATELLCGKGQGANNVLGAPPPRAACMSVAVAAARSTPVTSPATTMPTGGLSRMSKEKALGKEHADASDALNNLGRVRAKPCQLEEAVELYDRALDIRVKALSKEHAVIGDTLSNMARVRE